MSVCFLPNTYLIGLNYNLDIILGLNARRMDTLPRANASTQAGEAGAYPNKGTRKIDALSFSTICLT